MGVITPSFYFGNKPRGTFFLFFTCDPVVLGCTAVVMHNGSGSTKPQRPHVGVARSTSLDPAQHALSNALELIQIIVL